MSAIIQPPFTIVFQCMGSMNIYPVTFLDCVFQGMDNIDELSCHLSQLSVCFMVWKMSAIIQPPFTIVCKFQGLVWTTSVNYPTTFHNFSVCFRVWTTSANYLVTFHNCLYVSGYEQHQRIIQSPFTIVLMFQDLDISNYPIHRSQLSTYGQH